MTLVLGSPKVQFFHGDVPEFLAGGKVFTYLAGTTTPVNSYPSARDASNFENPNTNPVILDSRGEATIVLQGPTKIVLKDADDNLIWTVDDLNVTSTDIVDSDGKDLLTFEEVANAVNYIRISNGTIPKIETLGESLDVDLDLLCKGSGGINISSGNLQINEGDFNISAGDIDVTNGDIRVVNGDINVTDISQAPVVEVLPPGCVSAFGGATAPSGWLECDGSAVSRTTYADLFAVIGTTFGVGDGSTTFNLPNQARRVLVGEGGTGTGIIGNSIGDTGGAETHTLTESEMASHTHEYFLNEPNLSMKTPTPLFPKDLTRKNPKLPLADTSDTGNASPAAHNIVQPSLVTSYIIKT